MSLVNKTPLIDEQLYTVTWCTGRRSNLTKEDALKWASRIESDWKRYACRGRPDVKVWYRDGSRVKCTKANEGQP